MYNHYFAIICIYINTIVVSDHAIATIRFYYVLFNIDMYRSLGSVLKTVPPVVPRKSTGCTPGQVVTTHV